MDLSILNEASFSRRFVSRSRLTFTKWLAPFIRTRFICRSALRASLEAGGGTLVEGTVSAIDPAVDAVTRNVKLRASLPNPGDKLRPGMFVRVSVVLTHGDLLDSAAGVRHRGALLSMARRVWPRTLLKRVARGHGLFLLIDAVK